MMSLKGRVCVTGAGGFLGSQMVNLLLSKDYVVHGTVRDPCMFCSFSHMFIPVAAEQGHADQKYAHLTKFEKASDNLKLFKADLLDFDSLCRAIQGCSGVFHVACPVPSTTVPNPEVEVVAPAVKGTMNVLKACEQAKVERLVFVSSAAAVSLNPSWPKGIIMDESCWSNKEYCRTTENWYCFAKTEAESEALEYGKKSGLHVVSVCPTLILGPILQSTVNSSTLVLLKLLKEGYETLENKLRLVVDVRDVADSLLLVYEKPEAEGRYICTSYAIRAQDLVEKLRKIYPNYNYPKNFIEVDENTMVSSERLQRLGWSYRPLEETLVGSVESYRKAGLL